MNDVMDKPQTVTRIRRGYWRNVWEVNANITYPNAGNYYIPAGEYVSECRWPSREIAEEKAREYLDRPLARAWRDHARYVGARFYPERADA